MRCTSCGSSCASSSCGHRRCSCRGRRRRPLQHSLVVLSTLSTSSCSCSCMSIKGSAVVCTGLPLWVRRESDAPPAGTFIAGRDATGGGSCSLLGAICIVCKSQVFFCCECCRKGGNCHFCGLQNDNFWLCVELREPARGRAQHRQRAEERAHLPGGPQPRRAG